MAEGDSAVANVEELTGPILNALQDEFYCIVLIKISFTEATVFPVTELPLSCLSQKSWEGLLNKMAFFHVLPLLKKRMLEMPPNSGIHVFRGDLIRAIR